MKGQERHMTIDRVVVNGLPFEPQELDLFVSSLTQCLARELSRGHFPDSGGIHEIYRIEIAAADLGETKDERMWAEQMARHLAKGITGKREGGTHG